MAGSDLGSGWTGGPHEPHGFLAVERTGGQRNEEREPGIRCV
ncbi:MULTISPECIES: hypothetical protein [unclassified Streptomyces]